MKSIFFKSKRFKCHVPQVMGLIIMIWLLIGVTGTSFLNASPKEQEEKDAIPVMEKVKELDERFMDMGARIVTLGEYAPTNFPDFQDLEKANQLMEQLDFNNRKAELLVQQYNVLEDELFPFFLDVAAKNNGVVNDLALKMKDYLGTDERSIYRLQKEINMAFLQIERLEKKLERLQISARNKEIEKEHLQKIQEIGQSESISGRMVQLEEELKNFNREIAEERTKLFELREKEKGNSEKVEEKRKEIDDLKQKASNASNLVEKMVNTALAKVREIRLNGLEIPRLNTVKTFIYLSETSIQTLEKKIKDNEEKITSLKSQRLHKYVLTAGKGMVVIIIALIAVFLIMRISYRITKKIVGRIEVSSALDTHRKQRFQTLSSVILTFIKVALWIMALLWVLGELEVDYAPFLVAAGGISLAIGFGAQSLVKDIVSGFFMLMEEQFALGDGVEVNGVGGVVEKISLRTIKIRSLDGTLHTIPNGAIDKVSNGTYQWSRAVVKVGASYDDDPKKVVEVLSMVAKEMYDDPEWHDKFIEEPVAHGILSFGESSIDYRIIAKTSAGEHWALGREMHIRVKEAFDKAGIEIPYNYMNVNILDKTKESQ